MTTRTPTAATLIAAATLMTLPANAGSPAPDAAEPKIGVTLAADVPTAGADPFWLGVVLGVPEGWHLYWENPGDSGLPTTAEFTGPDGFGIGSVQYPGPDRLVGAGDVVDYGYVDQAGLLVRVTPPAAPTGDARFHVAVRWLACREACIPGQGEAELTLPLVDAGEPGAVELAPLLARLPRPLDTFDGAAAGWKDGAERPTWAVRIPGVSDPVFFPDVALEQVLERVDLAETGDGVRLELTLGADPPGRGVLAVARGDERIWVDIAVPPPR